MSTIRDKFTPAHLRFFRKTFSLSQAQAAKELGVSRVTWNRWENGAAIPAYLPNALRGAVAARKENAPPKDQEAPDATSKDR
jgi:DNA-binding XRE family transcriptional regulator